LTEHDASTSDVARTIEIYLKSTCKFVLHDFPYDNTCCCNVNTGKRNHAAREMRTFDLQVVTRKSYFRENLLTACGWQSEWCRSDKAIRSFIRAGLTNRLQGKVTNAAHFLLQNHEYGGYGDEPRRKRWVCIHYWFA